MHWKAFWPNVILLFQFNNLITYFVDYSDKSYVAKNQKDIN